VHVNFGIGVQAPKKRIWETDMPASKKRSYPDPQIAVSEHVTFHCAVSDSFKCVWDMLGLIPEALGCVFYTEPGVSPQAHQN
jgi:hypothetical protein